MHLNTLLTASAPTTTISGNTFTRDSDNVTIQDDVRIDNAETRNVVVSNNMFATTFSSAAGNETVTVDASNVSTNIRVVNNYFSADGGIDVANVTKVKIDGNTIVNPLNTAIVLDGGVTNSEVAQHDPRHSDHGGWRHRRRRGHR